MADGVDLEKLLHSIPWTQDFDCTFQSTLGDKIITVTTPVYAAPAKMIERKLHMGVILPEEELQYFPIGMMQAKNFSNTYYHFTKGEQWDVKEPRNDLYYLPLKKLSLYMEVQFKNRGSRSSVVTVYTLQGLKYPFPFVLLDDETEEGIVKHIPYQNHQGELSWYTQKKGPKETWEEYLDQLDHGTYTDLNLDQPKERIHTITAQRKKYVPSGEATPLRLAETNIDWTDPISINQSLDTIVESQPDAKKVFSVAVSRYITGAMNGTLHLHPVVLLIGPTGVGKTLMASHIAEKTTLPKAVADLQMQSGQGYVGGSVTDVFQLIHRQAKEEAPFGYVLYNELDKLAVNDLNSWGRQLQFELLSVLEKGQVLVPNEENKFLGSQNKNWFTTKNLFFAFTGAFVGLEEVIRKRLGLEKTIGFRVQHQAPVNKYELLKQTTTEDLINYGLIPELVGRITSITVLDALSKKDLANILSKPAMSPIAGHKKQLQQRGYVLEVEEPAYDAIAKACPQETGARALGGICEKIFTDIEYNPNQFVKGANKTIYLTSTLVEELLAGKYK